MTINITMRSGEVVPCFHQWVNYFNGRVGLRLFDENTGEPMAAVSINLPDIELDEDEMAINHDIGFSTVQACIGAGLLAIPHREALPSGSFVKFSICRVLRKD